MTGDEFAAWFRLLETPGLGRDAARRLLAACGSPAAVLAAPADTLRQLAPAAVTAALLKPPAVVAERLDQARRWLAGGPGRHAIAVGDADWPPLLLQTADPPLMLYVEGSLAALAAASLAVVGSRRATAQGVDNARAFSAELARQGWVIVSGLAQGIDAAAHEGALSVGAQTVAVMGTGPDQVYPAAHRDLARRIAAQGALVTEFAPGSPPLAEHFPLRNRIIAGLTQGTLVVEAALRSGSLITARLAMEGGREVYAIPGSIHAPQSRGCHALIKQGAKLVEAAADIVDELHAAARPVRPSAPPAGSAVRADTGTDAEAESADPVLAALGHDPVTLDALLARTGWPAGEMTARLLELELDGRVARLPGGLYQRRSAA